MPATTASALWNTGRRACALLLFVVLPAASQTTDLVSADRFSKVSRITLESDAQILADETPSRQNENRGHRLTWRSEVDAVQKISVSAPCVPGLWIRLTSNSQEPLGWKFIALETGRPRDLLLGRSHTRVSVWLEYDFLDTSYRQGLLPVVFTLTEG